MPRQYLAKYQQDELIFPEGSEGEECFVVIAGAVGIVREVDGRWDLLHRVGPGELFGELAIISSRTRSASAIALESDTTVIAVDKGRFIYLLTQNPGFAILVMETLGRWLHNDDNAPATGPSATTKLNERRSANPPCVAVPIDNDVWQLRSRTRACNSYLFKGSQRTLLIDLGLGSTFDALAECLNAVGVSPEDIDIVLLTHEHVDHVAAVPRFTQRRTVAAHRLTAHKIANGDEFAIMTTSFGETVADFPIDMILGEGAVIDTGGRRLRVLHTPGHTSGCISLIEEQKGLLVTGDVVLAGGFLGGVFGSGNISDMIYSLETLGDLRARMHLPGHGPLSSEPGKDIERALMTCRHLLADTRTIFEALNAQESTNKFFLSLRDIYR